MGALLQDLRFAVRMLLKTPSFTVVAVISLALGIGANTAIFSVVNAILLNSLPYAEPDRIVLAWGRTPKDGGNRGQVSATDVADWRSQNSVFEDITTYQSYRPIMSGTGDAERVPGMAVGDGYFQIMKIQPVLGRVFTSEEQVDGQDQVIVLGYGLWQKRFGGEPDVVGKDVLLNGQPHKIVGVVPAELRSLPTTLIEATAEFYRPVGENYDEEMRSSRHLRAIARLKPGVSIAQAQTEMDIIAARLEKEHPTHNSDYHVRVVSLPDDTVGGLKPTLLMLLGAVGFVLLIACANVGNLLLARSTGRQKEIAIRAALGAARSRLVRQFLTESILLAFCGGALGLLVALWSTSLIQELGSRVTPLLAGIHVDYRVLLFTGGVSFLTGIVFGLAPALHASRPDLNESLKEGGRTSGAGTSGGRLRSALVISEVAMALVLLVCATLLIKSVVRLRASSTGFSPDHILTMNVALPGVRYPKGPDKAAFFNKLIDRVTALPGVESAGSTSVLPFSGNFDGRGVAVEDFPRARGEEISVDLYISSPGYLHTMGIPLIKGRELTERDIEESEPVVLINETMASTLWGEQDPIGRRIKFPGSQRFPQSWRTIVGVVGDVSQYALDLKPPMQIYLSEAQFPTSFMTLAIRTTSDPKNLVASVRREVRSLDPDQAIYDVATLEELISNSISLRRFSMVLLITFAGLALIIAAIGIYGVISFLVNQRTHEIGIRMALGAERGDIIKLVVTHGMSLTMGGVGIGLLVAILLTRFLSSLLYSVSATDPTTFVAIPIVLTAVALVTCLVPARRATRVDPIVALRYE
jgi:putative ABC transport system permease protein